MKRESPGFSHGECQLAGFRDRYFLIVCLAVNAATNLTMNLVLGYTGISLWSVLIAEILVTFTEFAVYSLVTKTSGRKLLFHTVMANVLSFSAGIILQELFLAGRTAFREDCDFGETRKDDTICILTN